MNFLDLPTVLRFIEPCLPSPPTRLSLGPRIARSKHDTLYEAATAVLEFPPH